MKVQITRSSLRGWGAGALGLLLALVLLAGLAVPAYADDNDSPPVIQLFVGTARIGDQLAPEGTLVEGFVGGVKGGQDTVGVDGAYALAVTAGAGDAGKTITFTIAGDLARETATFTGNPGEAPTYDFDLTVPGESSFPLPLPFDCFIATAVYGTGTAGEIDVLREFRDVVLMPSRLGAAFVWLYYEVSPPVAGVISRHDFLRTTLRLGFIDPVVAVLNWSHRFWTEGER